MTSKRVFDRRQLVRAGMSGAMASMVPWSFGGAPGSPLTVDAEPHFFIFAQVYGAWDVCLAFDPKDRDATLPDGTPQFDQPYAYGEVRQFGDLWLAPQAFSLAGYADRMAVINGIEMEVDNGHIVDTMMTGVIDGRSLNAPYMQAVLAKRHPYVKMLCLPHVYASYDGQFLTGPYASASVTSTTADTLKLLGGGNANSFAAVRAMAQSYAARLTTSADRRLVDVYAEAAGKADRFSAILNDGTFQPPDDPSTPAGLGAFVGQLFQRQVLGSITWSLGERYDKMGKTFDTHGNHYAAHPLGAALQDIATLCDTLKALPFDAQRSVMDLTTVVLTAEFSRTARLNSMQGKDHNTHSNSVALIGKGVRAGTFGHSDWRREASGAIEPHAAMPIDLATGRSSATGTVIKAKNVWAGLGAVLGADLAADLGAGVAPITFLG